METYRLKRGADGRERVEVRLRGPQLLAHPMYNRSTAFTPEERRDLGLEGLLPDVVSTLEQQAKRAYAGIAEKETPLERYTALAALHDRNEHLFYRVLVDHLAEFLPVVYTPTVGLACRHYSRIFRRARGLWITSRHAGRMSEVLTNAAYEDVRLIVVTDNERVLGLGDQGAGGMALSQGKLALYVAAGGIHPAQTLPISLDVGTDNRALVDDELYIGWRQPRLRGKDYDATVDEFVRAVKLRFPKALLQWEDLEPARGAALLDRYRSELPSFSDDIQGQAALAVAAFTAGRWRAGAPPAEQRVVVAGDGPTVVETARLVRQTLQEDGVEGEALDVTVAVVAAHGLVMEPAEGRLVDVAWTGGAASAHGLESGAGAADVVRALHPGALLATPERLDEETVRELARHAERPTLVVLPSPSGRATVDPEALLAWSEGRALVAAPADRTTRRPSLAPAHSGFVFSGLALGVLVSEAREVTDGMLLAAAEAVAECVPDRDLDDGLLLPPLDELRTVTLRVAEAVARRAARDLVARNRTKNPARAVATAMWEPAYPVVEVS